MQSLINGQSGMSEPRYTRILLKLSGEALMGDDPFGINRAVIEWTVNEALTFIISGGAVAPESFRYSVPVSNSGLGPRSI